jgi:hypothetical protein
VLGECDRVYLLRVVLGVYVRDVRGTLRGVLRGPMTAPYMHYDLPCKITLAPYSSYDSLRGRSEQCESTMESSTLSCMHSYGFPLVTA